MKEGRKMNVAKVSGFLAASFLLLTLLGDTTEACKCARPHPQSAFCSADIVLRAKFVAVNKMEGNNSRWKYHEIKTFKIYKGPEKMKDVRRVYTPSSSAACGYEPYGSLKEEYLITGTEEGNRVQITLCNFIQQWAEITLAQRRGFTSEYNKGCSCSIVGHSTTSSKECHWTDPNSSTNQEKQMACLPQKEKNGKCHWQSLDTK